ncbi:hypothetical protein HOLleu_08023 [Holothuria leucospilota]|uniref:Uncharacterized protein n=1 Tax=Holothuria leucospilota TaxID=206669 RepID=A0A9Q1CGW2_HOLLE|nr:hypothetical protein HOLleu_08023 [Holothuria leucospilota]
MKVTKESQFQRKWSHDSTPCQLVSQLLCSPLTCISLLHNGLATASPIAVSYQQISNCTLMSSCPLFVTSQLTSASSPLDCSF